jgi:glycosyltransferase involved in cell wall biosynthesis
MRRSTSQRVDVTFGGFVLGHGGDAIQMLDLAAGVRDRGRTVRVVVPFANSSTSLAERGRERGIDVERSPALRADDEGVRQNLGRLVQFFRTHPADIVHLHTGDVCLPRSVVGVMKVLRLPPAVVTVHSPFTLLRAHSRRARYWANSVAQRGDTVIAPSLHGRSTQIQLGVPAERVRTIFNSVDIERFSSGQPNHVFHELGLKPDTKLIVFSSRLDPQKRPLDAVAAMARLVERGLDAHLAMIGSGALDSQVRSAAERAGISARVHLVGYREDVPDWLAASSAWILPTAYENFSLAVLEALAAGCAIVSTRCQGNDEMLHDGVDALTTDVGDVVAQTDALFRVLTDDALREKLREGARQAAEQHSMRRMIDEYEAEYDKLRSPRS